MLRDAGNAMSIDGRHIIIIFYLLVSFGVIVGLVLALGGGDWLATWLSDHRRRD